MATRCDVGIDAKADRRGLPHCGRDGRQHFRLVGQFQVELVEATLERKAHLVLGLADARKDDLVAGNARGTRSLIFAARDDVGAEARSGERRNDRAIGIGLDRISDQRIVERRQRGAKRVDVTAHRRGRIDIDRRADGRRNLGKRHVFAMKLAVLQAEVVHRRPQRTAPFRFASEEGMEGL